MSIWYHLPHVLIGIRYSSRLPKSYNREKVRTRFDVGGTSHTTRYTLLYK